jgi:RND family efflux transporter MFP subunit
VLLVTLLAVGSVALGQEPSRGTLKVPGPAADLERFRALDPAERLRAVEALAGAKDPFKTVARGDLTAVILERGRLDAATVVDLVCQVKARGKAAAAATIKWVVEDWTVVKKGDRLVELDDSALREEVQVARIQAEAAVAAATAATEEVRRANRAGGIAVRLAGIEVELAEADLKQPPAGQTKRVLELKVERAKLRVEQAKDEAHGRQTRAEAHEQKQKASVETAAGRLRDLEAELARCVLRAPFDGFAVYPAAPVSRFGGPAAVIAAGEPVREGQQLIRVVDLSRMVVGTRVHEAVISTVQVGQVVRVRVDAYPALELRGKVAQVSPTAAPADWARSDARVYPVTVALDDSPPGLKPTMSTGVQIVTGEKKGVLLVPARAVMSAGRSRFCFVKADAKLVEREVTTGATDGTGIEITAGVQEGDTVLADPSAVLSRPQPRK